MLSFKPGEGIVMFHRLDKEVVTKITNFYSSGFQNGCQCLISSSNSYPNEHKLHRKNCFFAEALYFEKVPKDYHCCELDEAIRKDIMSPRHGS